MNSSTAPLADALLRSALRGERTPWPDEPRGLRRYRLAVPLLVPLPVGIIIMRFDRAEEEEGGPATTTARPLPALGGVDAPAKSDGW